MTTRYWSLVIAAFMLLGTATASAANLVNRGGRNDVPTYDGRVWYIKKAGASCPSGFNCFCDTGNYCYLPGTGTITGTVVIDRSGVTLDCQDRIIQPPRFANSNQVCAGHLRTTGSSDCGQHSNGSLGVNDPNAPWHECVNGYCQLGGLAGINVGGPVAVDDGSININVESTGFVQDVEIVNCTVRNHWAGYNVNGFEGDNGTDILDVTNSELRGNFHGVGMHATDDSSVWMSYIHDNQWAGLDMSFNWGMKVAANTINFNNTYQVDMYGRSGDNRWPIFIGNVVESGPTNANDPFSNWGNVRMLTVMGSGRPCMKEFDRCDVLFEGNDITSGGPGARLVLRSESVSKATVSLKDNKLRGGGSQDVATDNNTINRCWDKGNLCYSSGSTTPRGCLPSALFAPGACWY